MPGVTRQLRINVSPEDFESLQELAKRCTEANAATDGANTHGAMTVHRLFEMLAEDAALVVSRPGSWEASHMREVLLSHGYDI